MNYQSIDNTTFITVYGTFRVRQEYNLLRKRIEKLAARRESRESHVFNSFESVGNGYFVTISSGKEFQNLTKLILVRRKESVASLNLLCVV